jgi:hypothetical protein
MCRKSFFKTGIVIGMVLGMFTISCDKDNPVAPVKSFRITHPANGATFHWGQQDTITWTLPADSSIDSVIVSQAKPGESYVALNEWSPVVAPEQSYVWYVGSDAIGQVRLKIQSKSDSTKNDEITVTVNSIY